MKGEHFHECSQRIEDRGISELIGIARGLVADGVVNELERGQHDTLVTLCGQKVLDLSRSHTPGLPATKHGQQGSQMMTGADPSHRPGQLVSQIVLYQLPHGQGHAALSSFCHRYLLIEVL